MPMPGSSRFGRLYCAHRPLLCGAIVFNNLFTTRSPRQVTRDRADHASQPLQITIALAGSAERNSGERTCMRVGGPQRSILGQPLEGGNWSRNRYSRQLSRDSSRKTVTGSKRLENVRGRQQQHTSVGQVAYRAIRRRLRKEISTYLEKLYFN